MARARARRRDPQVEQRWRELIDRWSGSGQTVRAFCRAEGLGECSFHKWRRELRRRDQEVQSSGATAAPRPPHFIELTAPGHAATTPAAPIEIQLPGGEIVRIGAGAERQLIAEVLQILRSSAPC